jgi:thymidylate kinase
MKITFVGAHGTGKTTLSDEVIDRLADSDLSVQTTPEVPRVICESAGDPEFFRRSKNTLVKQMTLLVGQPVYEADGSRNSDLLVCDRSILDHWSYTLHFYEEELGKSAIGQSLDALVKKRCSTYEQIFYLPIEFPVEADGTREEDSEFQSAIDSEIRSLLERYDLNFATVSGSVEERTEEVLAQLSRINKKLRDG